MQTSSLVQEMTERYRAVYEHLASGAQHLCNVDTGTDHLEQKKTEKIDAAHAAGVISAETGFDYDDLAELSSIRKDIDQLMGESPPRTRADTKAETEKQHHCSINYTAALLTVHGYGDFPVMPLLPVLP